MYDTLTIVGDPHLTNKSIEKVKKLCQIVEDQAKHTIWLGDMLDTKEVIRGKCLNFWHDYFKTSSLSHTILVGNHDWFNLDCEDHSLRTLKDLPNVTVVDNLLQLADGMYAIPYVHDRDELKKLLKKIPKDSVLFAHLDIVGFDYGSGKMCEEGILTRHISKFKRVISGHFHKFQQKGNLTYIGTPFSHTFGESNQTKVLGYYNKEHDDFQTFPTNLPQHVTFDVDCDTSYNVPIEFSDDDLVRIILIGKQENINQFQKDRYPNAKFIERPTDDGMMNIEISDTASNETQFENWATNIKNLDPETTKLGLEILEAVSGK